MWVRFCVKTNDNDDLKLSDLNEIMTNFQFQIRNFVLLHFDSPNINID